MKTFLDHAKARKLKASDRDRIVRERNWTGHELLSDADYRSVIAADRELHGDPAEPGGETPEGSDA